MSFPRDEAPEVNPSGAQHETVTVREDHPLSGWAIPAPVINSVASDPEAAVSSMASRLTVGPPTVGSRTVGSPVVGSPVVVSPVVVSPTYGGPVVGAPVLCPPVVDEAAGREDDVHSLAEQARPEPLPELQRSSQQDLPGVFITFEGCEGAGKSTQIEILVEWLKSEGIPVLATREPGGSTLGRTLRALLLTDEGAGCVPLAELFLLLADRAQHVSEVIRPSLAEGLVVICDRFQDSTLAYQVGAGGLDREAVDVAGALAVAGAWPRLTILLDVDPAVGLQRIERRFDRVESRGLAFHRQVRAAYLEIHEREPERIRLVDAFAPTEQVALRVQEEVQRLLSECGMLRAQTGGSDVGL